MVELAPYAADDHDWFVASDWSARRTGRPTASDHVLGVGGASTMLAQCTVRRRSSGPRPRHRLRGAGLPPGGSCAARGRHRRQRAMPRAGLASTRRINGDRLDLRRGSLFEPVQGERFDLVVSNPPFVIGSPQRRAARLPRLRAGGDAVCASVGPRRPRPPAPSPAGASFSPTGRSPTVTTGRASPRRGSPTTGLRRVGHPARGQDPAAYIEMWLRDAGEQWSPRYRELYDEWLDDPRAARGARHRVRPDLAPPRRAGRPGSALPARSTGVGAAGGSRRRAVVRRAETSLAADPASVLTAAVAARDRCRGRDAPRGSRS